MTKEMYVRPSVEELGSFEEITQASTGGTIADAAFPAGTPLNQIPTFS